MGVMMGNSGYESGDVFVVIEKTDEQRLKINYFKFCTV